jgi:hypothetical protein
MAGNPDYFKQYELNKKIVDFNNIPEDLINEFLQFSNYLNINT